MSDATRVAIVGLGAVGGSAALKLRQRGVAPKAFAAAAEDRDLAAAAGIDVALSIADAVGDADLVLIAVPLDQLATVARQVVDATSGNASILHAAGLQRPDATRLERDVSPRVIGTHPMAGTERSGFAAADAELFHGATVYVEERGDRRMREDAELFWSMAGAGRIEYLAAEAHDDLIAAASHVPQIVATALAATLAYADVPRSKLGPGGRDMTRLAASPWSMWQPLLRSTPGRTLAMLESIETELRAVREEIVKGTIDEAAITWSVARGWSLEEKSAEGTTS